MKLAWIISLTACAAVAQVQATEIVNRTVEGAAPPIRFAGNTSSNSSSNTSSDSGSRGSSYLHRHDWSVDADDRHGRRSVRGSTRIERYVPGRERSYRQRRNHRYESDDD
jgi:hypothetical protein